MSQNSTETTDEILLRFARDGRVTIDDVALIQRKLMEAVTRAIRIIAYLASFRLPHSEPAAELLADADDRHLTAHEVAELLSWSEETVYRKARAGKIPSVVVGDRSRRFPLSKIRRWIDRTG